MLERDYLMRMIAALTQAIARIAGLSRAGKREDAEAELDEAYRAILGMARADAHRLSPSSLAMILGTERARFAADLCDAEADMLEAVGDTARGAARRARATAIRDASLK